MEGKREQILRAAIKGVRMYGLDGIRMQHIGKLTGSAAGGIYGYFTGKEDLLRACFELVDRQIAALFDRIARSLPPWGRATRRS